MLVLPFPARPSKARMFLYRYNTRTTPEGEDLPFSVRGAWRGGCVVYL